MALKGAAFLALWNDFDPARDDDYNRWHTFEHVPERVGIDGVLSGRRYIARERSDRRYFTLYELRDLAALDGASYLDVVEHPTAWTLTMRASFRNFLRRPCATEFSVGQGHGAALGAYPFALSAEIDPQEWEAMVGFIVQGASAVALHIGRVDTTANFPLPNATPEPVVGVPYVLLIEGTERIQVAKAAQAAMAAIAEGNEIAAAMTGDVFDLAYTVQSNDLAAPGLTRQQPRGDLR